MTRIAKKKHCIIHGDIRYCILTAPGRHVGLLGYYTRTACEMVLNNVVICSVAHASYTILTVQ